MDINVAAVSDPKEVDLQQESKQPTRQPRSTRRWWRWLILLAILSCGAYLLRKGRENSQSRAAQGAAKSVVQSVPVEAAAARKGDISVYLNGLGSVTPFNTVTVKSRVDGQLIKVAFRRAGERLPVDAYDRSGMARIARGALLTVDNQIDPNTG